MKELKRGDTVWVFNTPVSKLPKKMLLVELFTNSYFVCRVTEIKNRRKLNKGNYISTGVYHLMVAEEPKGRSYEQILKDNEQSKKD